MNTDQEDRRTNKFKLEIELSSDQNKEKIQKRRATSFSFEREVADYKKSKKTNIISDTDVEYSYQAILELALSKEVFEKCKQELQNTGVTVESYEELLSYWLKLSGMKPEDVALWKKYIEKITTTVSIQEVSLSASKENSLVKANDFGELPTFLKAHLEETISKSFLNESSKEDLLEEIRQALANPDEKTLQFLLGFIEMFSQFNLTIANFSSEEDANMESCFEASKTMFATVKNKPSPYRRTILDTLAVGISALFEEYRFLSPERSLIVDPNIHDLKLASNKQYFNEGLSFVVIRRSNNTTVKHALIQ